MNDDGRVIICSPPSVTERRYCRCPTCKARRRFVVSVFVWYDAIWTCCSCGDSWSAGERMMRPALRGWRGAAAEKARDRWAATPPRAEARRLEEVMVREAQGEPDDQ